MSPSSPASGQCTLYLRADDSDTRFDPAPARPVPDLVRRTRVSIDRATGTAADGRLFSIEQIELWLAGGNPAVFTSWVEEHDWTGAKLLQRAAGLPILIGAGRTMGWGRRGWRCSSPMMRPTMSKTGRPNS